jgi:hypothetical protein
MQRVAVGVGIDGDRRDPHPARSLDHPAGDLAAIGDQYFLNMLFLLGLFRTWAVGRIPPRAIWHGRLGVTTPLVQQIAPEATV